MKLTIAPRGLLQIDDARIIYRNFKGEGSQFNREGDRNFSLLIDDEDIADTLAEEGWNVKIKPPREDGDLPFMTLPVKVKFNENGPHVYLKSGSNLVPLDGSNVGILDDVDIISVDMDLRPYDWEVNGKTGRSAYLQAMRVTQNIDRFAAEEDFTPNFDRYEE